jgi:predicted dinucleotide-binding enzyme
VARVQLPASGSAVAAIQELLGSAVRVVSAFQNAPALLLLDLAHVVDCDVLVCGDDVAARETVIQLIADIGMRALHAGPIVNSSRDRGAHFGLDLDQRPLQVPRRHPHHWLAATE